MKKVSIRKISKKSLSTIGKALLFCLEKGGDFMFEVYYPSLCQMMGREEARAFLDRKYGRTPPTIRRLRRNRWIKTKQIGEKIMIRLTENGKVAAIQLLISRTQTKLPDGRIIILVFDIPESARLLRQTFRNSLKRMGFRKIQLSVWGTNRDVLPFLRGYLKLLKISAWVSIFLSKQEA